jgi:hypothetical protein
MSKINQPEALGLMQQGRTDGQLAERYGTSRQAINLLRKQFEKVGKLPEHSTLVLVKGQQSSALVPKQAEIALTERGNGHQAPDFDDIEEWFLARLKDAKEVAHLRNVVAAQQNEIINLKNDLQEKTAFYEKRLQQKREYELAVRQGDLPDATQAPM